ncbi:TB2/DP1, HVA22 family-domain-containing protein [Obelidium mucronatum]|nr:TB2/DP1, HVA22 family-domain-containing protein [Obelidium mucronatum]
MADKVQVYIAQLDRELSNYPIAVEIEKRTNVPKAYFGAGILALLTIFVFFNVFGALITGLLGFLWPAYQSFKAIEKHDKDLTTQWLTYWTVFGTLNVVEVFSDVLLYWVPFYYAFKGIFVIYLISPQFNGAKVIYDKVLEPYLLKKQSIIDADIAKIKTKVSQVFNEKSSEVKQD